MTEPLRLGRLRVSAALLVAWLRDGFDSVEVVANPLPKDAALVGVKQDWLTDALILTFKSEEFAAIELGDDVPELPAPVFRLLELDEIAVRRKEAADQFAITFRWS